MKSILLTVLLVLTLSSCSLLGGASDYDSHVKGRVEFKKSDDTRIASQSASISEIALQNSGSPEAAAYKNALAMLSIAMLKNQDYNEQAPMTWTQVGSKVVDAVPFVAGVGGMYLLGKEGIRAAGNVMIGENSPVNGSFNKPTATSVGEGQAVATPSVEVVKPEVVHPVVIKPGVE